LRHASLALLLPFSLVAGLLTFPTTCGCGEAWPHDHALFALSGHHHDADGNLAPPPQPTDAAGVEAAQHGVALELPTINTFGDQHALTLALGLALAGMRGPAPGDAARREADLWRAAPPIPPPRGAANPAFYVLV
jgi:hypothetical protein